MTFSNTSGNYLLDTTNEMSGRYVDGTRPSYQIIVQSNRVSLRIFIARQKKLENQLSFIGSEIVCIIRFLFFYMIG